MKRILGFALLTLIVGNAVASLDEIKPVDDDQAIRLVVVAPETRALPSHADRKPSVGVFAHDKRLVTLYPHQAEFKHSLEGQAPLAINEKYVVWYQAPYSGSSSYNLKLLETKMQKALVTYTVNMKRIDVHHIVVTRPDGSKYTVKGEWKLSAVKLNGDKEEETNLGSYATGLGLDVPAGFKYRILVKGQSEDGPTQYKAELDFTRE